MRHPWVVCGLLGVVACGGGGDGGGPAVTAVVTPGAGGTLTSADGRLVVVVPPGAVAADTTVSVATAAAEGLEPAPWEGGTVYELGPDGQTFTAPVELTLTVPLHDVGAREDGYDLPVVGLFSRSGDAVEGLPARDGSESVGADIDLETGEIRVLGRTTHFSRVWGARDPGLSLDFTPHVVTAFELERFPIVARLANDSTGPVTVRQLRYFLDTCATTTIEPSAGAPTTACAGTLTEADVARVVVPNGQAYLPTLTATCAAAGTARPLSLFDLRGGALPQFQSWAPQVQFKIDCVAPPDPPPPPRCDPARPETQPVADLATRKGAPVVDVCAAINLLVDDRPTVSSFGSVPSIPRRLALAFRLGYTSFAQVGLSIFLREARGGGIGAFACGSDGAGGMVLCAPGANPTPPGQEYRVVFAGLGADVDRDDPTNLMQYAFVFDADGVAGNNYQADPAYPNDFFQGTDRWYVADYQPSSGWQLRVTSAAGGALTPAASDARFLIDRNLIALIVPVTEVPGGVGGLMGRVTAFRHTGDYGENPPHDWDGDVEPPVDVGLANYGP